MGTILRLKYDMILSFEYMDGSILFENNNKESKYSEIFV